MSSAIRRRSFRLSGTSPATMRWARPSTIAVLPTPGSPISTGLFLVRRESTWITRRISSSRPITGSSLPLRATSVRSRPNFASAWYFDSGSGSVTRALPRTAASALSDRLARRRRRRAAARPAGSLFVAREREQQVLGGDVLVLELLGLLERGLEHARRARGESCDWAPPDDLRAGARARVSSSPESASSETPSFWSTGTVLPSGCASSARSRCAGWISLWPRALASDWASARASWLLIVSLSKRID